MQQNELNSLAVVVILIVLSPLNNYQDYKGNQTYDAYPYDDFYLAITPIEQSFKSISIFLKLSSITYIKN